MKVNIGVFSHNAKDWERVQSGDYSHPPETPDWQFVQRTERVTFGTMVAVAPWWHPIRLAHQIAYLDIVSKGALHHHRPGPRRCQV